MRCLRNLMLVSLLMTLTVPAVAQAPSTGFSQVKPALNLTVIDGHPSLTLENALPWQQAAVMPDGQGKWVVIWAGSDGENGGLWKYTVTIDSPHPGPGPGPDPEPIPTPNPWTPDEQWKPIVAPVKTFPMVRQDATAVANLYGTAAKNVTAGSIKTTLELRAYLVEHGVKLGLQGKYAGLGDAVTKSLETSLGMEVRPLPAHAAAFLDTLAWAVWENGR